MLPLLHREVDLHRHRIRILHDKERIVVLLGDHCKSAEKFLWSLYLVGLKRYSQRLPQVYVIVMSALPSKADI